MTEEREKAARVFGTAHLSWLTASGILLVTAAMLEELIAMTHGVPVTSIHEHTIVPAAVHLLAVASIPVGQYPVLRKKPFVQTGVRVAVVSIIAALLVMGHTLVASFLAFVISASTLAWRRLTPR